LTKREIISLHKLTGFSINFYNVEICIVEESLYLFYFFGKYVNPVFISTLRRLKILLISVSGG